MATQFKNSRALFCGGHDIVFVFYGKLWVVCNGVCDLFLLIHAPKEYVLPKSGRIFSKNYGIVEVVYVYMFSRYKLR